METVLITGGTGLIGKALTRALLEKNYHVIILSRATSNPELNSEQTQQPAVIQSEAKDGNLSYAQWNINDQTIDKEAIAKADHIIHLAGAGIADKRWTKKRKQEIVDSRVKSGELLVKALKENTNRVKTVISSSAIGWYGPDPVIPNPHPFTEEVGSSDDFLGTTCRQWEESIAPLGKTGKRLVNFRIGVVLSREGGALKEFEKPLRFGAATILGSGKQIISWIHMDDLVRLYIAAIENENMNGVYNAVAPHPVSNRDFMLKLATIAKGKFFIPLYVPSFLLKWVFGEISMEVLKSATVSCAKIQYTGFTFLYSSIDPAVKDLYDQGARYS
ncbi:MAG TPA: TIGR01777 family oxidoreductase [Chitinophagaceae bacterium]